MSASERRVVSTQLGVIFPGQGSQAVGMLHALGQRFREVGDTFDEASDALGYDLWKLVEGGPEQELNRTDRTQPAMLAAGVAVWRAWCAGGGPLPAVMAGHSLGEYTALVCSGSLDLAAGVALVAERGRRMQEAVPAGTGAMAAVLGLDDAAVKRACAEAAGSEVVAAVNFNAPGQVVIAGHAAAVQRAIEKAKAAGAKRAVTLPVSVPSHCILMRRAADAYAHTLDTVGFGRPAIPVLHNVDVASYEDPTSIRNALAMQLFSPVRWVETVQAMARHGVTTLVEAGPGKVLTGLCKRIDRSMTALAVYDPDTLAQGLAAVQDQLGEVHVAG
ncbi:MAG TPA: ACP S-malonyltransferase [Gammaproteobacteria bacterium]|nr:ACP S-malonyltransferase [Gammaproteobacteria bacterium]